MQPSASCIFCGCHSTPLPIAGSTIRSDFTSLFLSAQEIAWASTHKFYFGQCPQCGVNRVFSSSHLPLLGSQNPSITYKEPSHHHNTIASKLQKYFNKVEYPINIFMHSKKDESLAHVISSFFSSSLNINIVHPNRFDEFITDTSPSINVWLLSRFIEHINKKELLDELLICIAIGDYVIIEMLDFYALFCQLNTSFLWDERTYYPTKKYLLEFLLSKGFEVLETYIDSESEPFFVLVVKRISLNQSLSSFHSSNVLEKDILSSSNSRLLDYCHQRFKMFRSFSFYGVNHKAFLIASILTRLYPDAEIKLFDSSSVKLNSVWNSIVITDFSNVDPSSECHIFAFDGEFSSKIKSSVLRSNPTAHILSLANLFHPLAHDHP